MLGPPSSIPKYMNKPINTAANEAPGIPNKTVGTMLVAFCALLAPSGPITPLILPLPNFSVGFAATVAVVSILAINHICKITAVPYKYYFPLLLGIITWACMQYTGGGEDLAMLIIFSILGLGMKHYKYSRPAMLMAFILADKIENLTLQLTALYTLETLIIRPIFVGIMITVGVILVYSIRKKGRIDYA